MTAAKCARCQRRPIDGVLIEASDDSQYADQLLCVSCDMRLVEEALREMGIVDLLKMAEAF